jgi:hypothetical protein
MQAMLSGPHRDAIIGDIVEDFRQGRSGAWFWRQSLAAVFLSNCRDMYEHKVLTVRSVLTGTAVLWLAKHLVWDPVRSVLPDLNAAVTTWLQTHGVDAVRFGWLLNHLNDVAFTAKWCAMFTAAGWAVAKLHKAHARSMLFAYLCAVLVWGLLFAPRDQFDSLLSLGIYWFVVAPSFVVVGGFLAKRSEVVAPPETLVRPVTLSPTRRTARADAP